MGFVSLVFAGMLFCVVKSLLPVWTIFSFVTSFAGLLCPVGKQSSQLLFACLEKYLLSFVSLLAMSSFCVIAELWVSFSGIEEILIRIDVVGVREYLFPSGSW